MDIIDYALFYASKKWQVFPCRPHDKTPLVKWADEATTDAEKIKAWWKATPNANIGIATGARSGIVVLDIDAGHGGEKTIAALIEQHGEFPITPQAHTGGGGRHIVFQHPGVEVRNSASKVGDGIDVRGDGGYIVAAPSIHPNGNEYKWIAQNAPSKTTLAAIPAWLLEAMNKKDEAPAIPQERAVSAAFTSGSRNSSLTSLGGTMRRRGMSEEAIYNALMVENSTRCVPPLSPDEVRGIAESVTRYTPQAAPLTNKYRERLNIEWMFAKCLYDNESLVTPYEWLEPSMFSDESVQAFWDGLRMGKDPVHAATDAGILSDIKNTEADPAHIADYAAQIARFGFFDNIADAAKQLQVCAQAGDLERTHRVIESLTDKTMVSGEVIKGAFNLLMDLQNSLTDDVSMIRTGIPNFDRLIGGLERKKMSILAARPSVGKTTLAWQIARNVATSGKKVVFFEFESAGVNLWKKAAFGIAEVTNKDVLNKDVSPQKLQQIQTEIIPDLVEAYDEKLFIYDEGGANTDTIWKIVMQHAPDFVVIDHLAYVTDKNPDEILRLGQITRRLKNLARKSNTHIMVIHQLSRAVEGRDDKKPQLSDLRGSGHLEQDADVVIMPYRPEYYDIKDASEKPRYSETQLLIRKNRDDEAGLSIALFFDVLQQWFYRLDDLPLNWKNVKLH